MIEIAQCLEQFGTQNDMSCWVLLVHKYCRHHQEIPQDMLFVLMRYSYSTSLGIILTYDRLLVQHIVRTSPIWVDLFDPADAGKPPYFVSAGWRMGSISTVWTQLTYLFNWRTAKPLGPHLFVISRFREYQTIPSPYSRLLPIGTQVQAVWYCPFEHISHGSTKKYYQSVVRGEICFDHCRVVFTSIFGSNVKLRQWIRQTSCF